MSDRTAFVATNDRKPRMVLFRASGHTGRMTAAALAARGQRRLLVGRRAEALGELAEEPGGLDWALADADDGSGLAGLLAE